MGNHTRSAQPTPALPTQRPRPQPQIRGFLRSVIYWLRSGYPDDAPVTGYSPLLALNGSPSLTPQQTQHALAHLSSRSATGDIIDIQVAITAATGQLPTDTQTAAIAHELRRRYRL